MYIDLNFPVPTPATQPQNTAQSSKKNKGKQNQVHVDHAAAAGVAFSPGQLTKIESRIDLLVRLGYSVLAFTQNAISKVDPKTHVNTLDPLMAKIRKREGVLFLKRLTITLDDESEKGFGLTAANTTLFNSYDILALKPTTASTLSLACLTHTLPSPLTTHIISLPLTAPQTLRLKHTLVRTAIKNGGVFELDYSGALEEDDVARRNWWAAAREVTRVTKGKSVIVSSGAEAHVLLRAPRDAGNLLTLVGLAQDQAHAAGTTTPKSLILRAQTRKTYRAVLSEPVLIMPTSTTTSGADNEPSNATVIASPSVLQSAVPQNSIIPATLTSIEKTTPTNNIVSIPTSTNGTQSPSTPPPPSQNPTAEPNGKKRAHDQLNLETIDDTTLLARPNIPSQVSGHPTNVEAGSNRKRKKKDKDKSHG